MEKKTSYFIIVAVVASLSLFPFLGLVDFHTKGEPREAIVAYSMLESGNWILPVNNGGDIAYKPPMFHWCIALFSTLADRVDEYTSRLPSAVALVAMVLAGYSFYARRRGATLALLTALVTLSNFEIHRAGMNCRVDMLLTAFIVLALYQLFKWCECGTRGFPWLAIVFMGCATLTKGPVGIILPCLVAGVYLLIRGMNFFKAFFKLLLVAVVSCVIPAVWYYAAWRQGGDGFLDLVIEENFSRFAGKMSYESHEEPLWYNFVTVAAGYIPYTLLALFSLFMLRYGAAKKCFTAPHWWKRFRNYIKEMDDTRLYSLLSIVLIFVFYCVPKSKRSVYLLPIYPFIAYFLAEYIVWLSKKGRKALSAYGWTLSGLALLLTFAFGAVALGLVPETIFHGRHAAENVSCLLALENMPLTIVSVISIALAPAVAIYFMISCRGGGMKTAWCSVALAFAIFVALDGAYQPAVLNAKSDRTMASEIGAIVPSGDIYSFVSADMMRFFVINFYEGNRVKDFEKENPRNGYLLVGENDFEEFLPKHEADYDFTEVYRSRKRGCDVRQIVTLYRFNRKPQPVPIPE